MSRSRKKRNSSQKLAEGNLSQDAFMLVVLACTAYFFIALYSQYSVAAGQSEKNVCGAFGGFLASSHFAIFGAITGYVSAIGLFALTCMMLFLIHWWTCLA